MRNIKLYGKLANKYGDTHKYDVLSIAESVRAMDANYPGFKNDLREGHYALVRGEDLDGENLSLDEATMNYKSGDFHIVPVPEGSKGGFLSIVAGAALIAVSIWNPVVGGMILSSMGQAMVAGIGASLMLGGISQMLAPTPNTEPTNYQERERPEERPSDFFNGPTNTTEQGNPVPVVHGQFVIGSIVVSTGLDVEELR